MTDRFRLLGESVRALPLDRRFGRVVAVRGALVEVAGLGGAARVGSRLAIENGPQPLDAEVIGLDEDVAQCLAFQHCSGLASGARAELIAGAVMARPSPAWLGRVVDGLGRPLDGLGALPVGLDRRPTRASPLPAAERQRVGERVDTHVAVLDLFVPLCRGQRLGLFAGSGIGKSVLMSQLARWTACDVAVIALIGERGREVQEFIAGELGPEGLARSVIVVATSDEPALMRRQAAWTAMAVAEYFRDSGKQVLFIMDSVTRFAMAQREIGLAGGEPPATKGYTPTVFAELPRLLERAGPGRDGEGAISGVFTVLVDGDDHNEPIADAVRGILDGHVVLDRKIAERGRFPAVDILRSVSRTLPHCLSDRQNHIRMEARRVLSLHADVEEVVRLGAYRPGANPAVDRAVEIAPAVQALLTQARNDPATPDEYYRTLGTLIGEEI